MVVEALSGLLRKAIAENMYKGYLVGSKKVDISILQYADDTIFFGEATMENVRALKATLRAFELISGLKINYAKSCFGAFEVSDQWRSDAAKYLNCTLLSIPFTYLGMPIGANPRRTQMWNNIIHKYERKLDSKNSGGKAQKDTTKIPWVKWDTVCLSKNKGGLGIKDLSNFNEALLGKWGWELANNQNQPWARILLSKYGGWKELISSGKSKFSSQWWQDLKAIF
ncbi:uncharacterized protein LOC114373081 [Glycine soja]|uniref:uncharacterized protein LOC114373081 n=1 Tax=Glycine soja TaxID=3848 RepID=UPI00103A5DE0|nr:uncharacterized protein LOC114373081 [Glycine soja]